MGTAKPTGEYAEQMLEPGGWVETDEQSLYDRGQEFTRILQQVTGALEGFQHERAEIFNGGIWSGAAAKTASGKLGQIIDELTGAQNNLVNAITWYNNVAASVAQTKTTIAERVHQAQQQISNLENDSNADAQDQAKAIASLVNQAHGENVNDVTAAAAKVPTAANWKPPPNALKNLLSQKSPPQGAQPGPSPRPDAAPSPMGLRSAGAPAAGAPAAPGAPAAAPGAPAAAPGAPAAPVLGPRSGPMPAVGGAPAPARGAPRSAPPAPGAPAAPTSPLAVPGPGIGAPSAGGGSAAGGGGGVGGMVGSLFGGGGGAAGEHHSPMAGGLGAGQQPPSSGEGVAPELDRLEQGMSHAAMGAGQLSAAAQVPLAAAEGMIAPAAALGQAAAPEVPAAMVGAQGGAVIAGGDYGVGGSSAGGGGGLPSIPSSSGMSTSSPMPLGPPPTPPAAAPIPPGGGTTGAPGATTGPGVHPASTTSTSQGGIGGSMNSAHAEAAPAPIPVSSARAQKDAIAEATRRQSGGDLQLAYRVAAALNAPDMVNKADFRFFWMTAVTGDGQILVANSYGLGYIPDGVSLPTQVNMVSADDTIPAEERARWATYPNLALQGWAAHHNTVLRVVIGRQEHFAGTDPGAPEQFVADEDIPTSGQMQGRSRLAVVAPAEATRLAAVSDLVLIDMLPPAPVDASPPADQRSSLWWELMKHLMSSDADRGVAHLQAFAAYATHAQELAIYRAYTAVHAVEQRAAIADWLYWQHIAGLLNDALASSAR
jgi:hypothetical protein